MNNLAQLVTATLADPLAAARAHAAAGGRVIGYYTCNVPPELLLAAGAFPLYLPHRVDGATPRADRYMEPLFDRALRSAFDAWLAGEFAFLDVVVLPRSQDSAQRAYYYVEELIRTGQLSGPRPLLFDLLKVPRPESARYTLASARRLASELGVGHDRLLAAIGRVNGRRRLLARLAQRMATGTLPDAPSVTNVLAAGLYAEWSEFDAALADWLDLPSRSGRAAPRIALLGSAPPDERLQQAIASAGGATSAMHHPLGPDRHGPLIETGGDPLDAVSGSYHAHVHSVRDFGTPLAAALAGEERPDGAVLWLTEEDDALAWQVPAVVRRANGLGLPLLALVRQDWLADATTLAAVGAFVAALGDP
jgi:hypothetical protein